MSHFCFVIMFVCFFLAKIIVSLLMMMLMQIKHSAPPPTPLHPSQLIHFQLHCPHQRVAGTNCRGLAVAVRLYRMDRWCNAIWQGGGGEQIGFRSWSAYCNSLAKKRPPHPLFFFLNRINRWFKRTHTQTHTHSPLTPLYLLSSRLVSNLQRLLLFILCMLIDGGCARV